MTGILRSVATSVLVGSALTVGIAWAAVLTASEVTAVPQCSRVWSVDADRVGSVLETEFDWWVPVESQWVGVQTGKIVLTAQEDEWPDVFFGPVVYFTGYDSWAASLDAAGVCQSAPSWYERFNRPNFKAEVVTRVASGWPWRCLEGFSAHAPPRDTFGLLTTRDDHGILFRTRWGSLPYWPLTAGLAGNVLAWSTVVLAFRLTPQIVMHQVRRHRGHCHLCNYDLLGEFRSGCPECGWNRTLSPDEGTP